MTNPFIAELRIVSFNYAPKGWALAQGQLLPINQNQALFSLLGTTYGGDGRVNFALPDLRARAPMHMGNGHTLGERAGEQSHTLNINELPQHLHPVVAVAAAAGAGAVGRTPGPTKALAEGSATAASGNVPMSLFSSGTVNRAGAPGGVGAAGGSQAHENMQPYLVLNFCIALTGIFPSQN